MFADWLDENGEPERAEYIRLACAGFPGGYDRAWELWKLISRSKHNIINCNWGFVTLFQGTLADWMKYGHEIAKQSVLERVTLMDRVPYGSGQDEERVGVFWTENNYRQYRSSTDISTDLDELPSELIDILETLPKADSSNMFGENVRSLDYKSTADAHAALSQACIIQVEGK